MANQTETAKLSLVGKHSHAVAFTTPDIDLEQSGAIINRLPAILQTTLELDELVQLFQDELQKVMTYDSFHYQHRDVLCDINTAKRSLHKCTYRLEMNSVWLGELTLTRGKKFRNEDTQLVEDFLCKFVYPLRNCLLYRQAQRAGLQDKLTGLNNRAAFDNNLTREVDLAQRQHTPLSLVLLDIDHFKTVNDSYGHSTGDIVLRALADSIVDTLRRSDIAFRYGGEEFALILSNTDTASALLVAERIRIAAFQLNCNDGDDRHFNLTVSLGVSELKQGEKATAFFDRADRALYKAKKSGRNKSVSA
ncbi:MAG: diguanylate cyclase (GGDEF)-like protein [Methylophagaceae bacterium]|jgi:diguanylate cyclase (GGDEF)-like protein